MTSEVSRSVIEDRIEPRDEVYHRARTTLADHRTVSLVVVNVSPHGLMARCEAVIAVGEWVKVQLPVVGELHAAVRWSLGGRIGCQFDRAITPRDYGALLATMTPA